MTQSKHTQGPWYSECATVWKDKAVRKSVASCDMLGNPLEAEANARLIAASPLLLESLELMLNLADFDCMDDKSNEWRSTMIKARAAIAKAKGEA